MGVRVYSILMQETNMLEAIPRSGTAALLELPAIESLVQYVRTIINTHSWIIMISEEGRLEKNENNNCNEQ